MLETMLASYFTRDHAAIMHLEVATHQPHPQIDKFRASDAGKCHRMRYWKRQGKPGNQEFSLEVQLALQTGNLLHAFLEHALSVEGKLFVSELLLETPDVIGHLDAIVVAPDGRRILYDFKTVGGKQMYYLHKDAPKPEHVAQILTYHHLYLKTQPDLPALDESRIVYISRDTFELLDLHVADDLPSTDFITDWEVLIDFWRLKKLPPMLKPGAWECKYCMYHQDCQR